MTKKYLLLTIAIACCYPSHAQIFEPDYSKLRVAVSGGYAYRLGKKPSGDPYFRDISQGPVFNAGLIYFFNSKHGLGADYSLFSTAGSLASPSVLSNIKIAYFGASYHFRQPVFNEKAEWLSGIGVGYIGYRDQGWIDRVEGTIKGGSVGTFLATGIDFKIVKGLSAGIDINLYGGSLSSITRNGSTTELEGDNRESLTRVESVAGLRYNF
ncbi:outer membrane beta-barrel protein [Niabella yanshanensis]|uniref:Outer membrane beta-barrel protein n=1 Tax=Niabella yanshanensis TaxID=577386 RepID=A0ABZ0W2S3_9BACT|nr:outer membrane beta-barrel protein [Niabella yanshanensis]WQD37563.1 outer membrane beta-barrel protein [Niabella yanshanensis]